ncbi:RagB/SusD family nutrient uptake outer membrane protein [Mangrovibacterium diazotrophicum]|uniref:Putative outer membrane starch-binding protein n=1 Tax=Mangrovibacterium diazotrophicum TaxID=1261403 RepID=A0A419W9M5_9BACT|nr:RagB/SusD family nutrient uptake outer membrane protein [Mangrovibacterium diazotrophicum]RKD92157.1 putative outer membrane starch-binding protein [Mangrovibacterium diazotrophicum]
MKKYLIIASLSLIFGMISCSDDFLDLESPTKLTIDDYYTTEARIYEALIAAYSPLEWFDWGQGEYNPINIMSDVMGDDMWSGGSSATDNESWHLQANYSVTPIKVMSGIWTSAYKGVHRCNNVMYYMPGVTDIDDATKNLYEAEAKVLRAYYYSLLWKFWGAVPYYTTNLTDPYVSGKSPADDVYEGIIADLEDAITNGGLPMKQTNASLDGRVTLATAYMIYADVVMYQNDDSRYAQALAYMKGIIADGSYSLTDDFADIWTEDGEWNDECIFAINYFNDGASRSWSNPYYAGGTVLPQLISPYGLVDGTDGFNQGWGFGPVREAVYDMYDDGDTRRDATVLDAREYSYTERYEDTGFWLKKYCARTGYNDGQIADAQLNYGNDLRIYRYSETLLNAAELLIQTGGSTGDAQTYLDEVRTRAGLTAGSATVSIDNIITERRLEFVGEGKRYWDLIRSGKAASTLTAGEYRTVSWTSNKKYLPIPDTEISASDGQLEQNTDY